VRGGAVSCWQEGTSTPTLVPGLDLVKGKHEPFGWIEPKSKLKVNSAGTAWRMRSEATLVPSDFTEVENACRGTATAEIYYLRKARGKKASSANNSPAKVHIGVRTSGKLRRVGSYCRVSFRHTVPLSRFASKRKKLLLGLEFGGNAVMSRYETGYWLGG
jgi:hypothetical protein